MNVTKMRSCGKKIMHKTLQIVGKAGQWLYVFVSFYFGNTLVFFIQMVNARIVSMQTLRGIEMWIVWMYFPEDSRLWRVFSYIWVNMVNLLLISWSLVLNYETWSTQDFLSIILPTEGMINPLSCFRQNLVWCTLCFRQLLWKQVE